jgi:hypothetical protein
VVARERDRLRAMTLMLMLMLMRHDGGLGSDLARG